MFREMPTMRQLRRRIEEYLGDVFSRTERGRTEKFRRILNTSVCAQQLDALIRLRKETGVPRSRLIDKILEEGIPIVRKALGI